MRELIFLSIANHLPRLAVSDYVRFIFYRLAGVRVLGRAKIFGPLTIRPIGAARNISIGDGTFMNTEIRFGCPDAKVSIGRNCQIGPRVCFETVNHEATAAAGARRGYSTSPIVVEDEVWIGCGAILLPGVTVGRGAVVGAGAVVTRDVPPDTAVMGVPAKPVKRLR